MVMMRRTWGLCVLLLVGCESTEDPPPPAPAIERPQETVGGFYDTFVSGLTYTSASGTGITDEQGLFDIVQGETVTFSIGGVTLGSTQASSAMTPLDFVTGSDSSSRGVLNRIQFLLALDDDALWFNGIQITEAMRTAAANWSVEFDLDQAAFELEVADELAEAKSVSGAEGMLAGAEAAREHFESTFFCVYTGMFTGVSVSTTTGTDGIDDEAVFTVSFHEGGSGIYGFYSDTIGRDQGIINGEGMSPTAARTFVVGDVENGGTFEGAFVSANWIEGTWENADEAEGGTFKAKRVGHQEDARYRFVGTTTDGDDFAMDIDAAGNVTGAVRLSSEPALASATITGTFDEATGALVAAVDTPEGMVDIEAVVSTQGLPNIDGSYEGGTFFGNGCQLR